MDYDKFLSHNTLDKTQAGMIITIIKQVAKKPELKTYTDEDLHKIEQKFHCKLPDDLRWFLKNIGEGYCPGGYFFKMDNEFNKNVNLESPNPLDWMLTVMHFGCTLFGVIMLKGDSASCVQMKNMMILTQM